MLRSLGTGGGGEQLTGSRGGVGRGKLGGEPLAFSLSPEAPTVPGGMWGAGRGQNTGRVEGQLQAGVAARVRAWGERRGSPLPAID